MIQLLISNKFLILYYLLSPIYLVNGTYWKYVYPINHSIYHIPFQPEDDVVEILYYTL